MPRTKSDREKGRPRSKQEQLRILRNLYRMQFEYLRKFGNTKYRPLFVREWYVKPFPLDDKYEEDFNEIINYYKNQIDLDELAEEFEMEYGISVNEYQSQVIDRITQYK